MASNWVLVVLTLVLVSITGYYAFTNWKMYLEMVEGRKRALRPLLSIELIQAAKVDDPLRYVEGWEVGINRDSHLFA